MSDHVPSPFRIPTPNLRWPFGVILRGLLALFARLLRLHRLEALWRHGQKGGFGLPFVSQSLAGAGLRYSIPAEEFARIPGTGPMIVVANHPHGFLDGLVVADLIGQVRPDLKFLANHLLARMPEMAPLVIPMDPFGGEAAQAMNLRAMRDALKWFRDGHVIILFPAGAVAPSKSPAGNGVDGPWQRSAATLARRAGVPVVPLFIEGTNSGLFLWLGKIHPIVRTLLLPREFVRRWNSTIRMRIGHVIAPERLERFASDEELTDYLRLRSELLGRNPEGSGRERKLPDLFTRRRSQAAPLKPLIDPVPAADLLVEINGLPESCHLFSTGRFRVALATADQLPLVMREISRLREKTFRIVGEGTGESFDRDVFDETYLHLFVWDDAEQRIAGAYRLGESDRLLERGGVDALYTATLFSFDRSTLDRLSPGLEMGRSFVSPEYQRNFMPLLLLWRGIAAHIARNPHYTLLFGPVSISADYKPLSQDLMLRHLTAHRFVPEWASGVKPRHPVTADAVGRRFGLCWSDVLLGDLEEVSRMVADVEGEGRGVPVLMREYLKLGGRFIGFNRDPLFSNVVDGLVVVDLRQTDPKLLRRYFGDEAALKTFGTRVLKADVVPEEI